MIPAYPIGAHEIGIEWVINEGGIGVTAQTDNAGLPYIGLYPLSLNGYPSGLPCEFYRQRLMISMVAGFIKKKPITVFLDAEITTRGLTLRVNMPPSLQQYGYPRLMSAKWGSPSPRLSHFPANSNWPVVPWPSDGEW